VVSSDSSEVITRNYSYLAGSGSNTSPLVSSLTANHGSTNLFSGNYSYDSVGNITAITGSAPAAYTYDSQNQLLTEVRDGTTYTYTYDAAGNMLSKTKTSGSGTDTFTYGNAEWRDLLTAYNGNAITYDTVGNPTTWYDGAAMTWVNGKRLASISAASGHSALAFTYDADGLRLTKTVGTGSSAVEHKYTWQGGKLIAEYDGTNTLEFFYDESGTPYAFSCNGTTYYYVTNLQGDVVKIVDASGTSQAEYSYNAWGQVISATGTLAAVNPIRYRGYYYDKETELYYVSSRYYDPEICRFINADDTSYLGANGDFISYNLFAYCLNNPINRTDDGGNLSVGNWIKIGIGAVALGAAIALTVATGGGAAAVAVGIAKIVGSVALSTATSAGLGYLANGKEGAIDGACNGFMFGSLSACGGAALKYTQVRAATTGTPNSIGQAGERMAGIDPKAKQPININGRTRIPDALTDSTLTEVKNVKYISNTQQLRDFADFANATGRTLDLYVRPTTRIAQTVIDAGWNIRYLW